MAQSQVTVHSIINFSALSRNFVTVAPPASKADFRCVEENQMKKAKPYDSAEFLDSPKAIKYYLEEAMESGDPQLMSHAVGVVARAKRMNKIARESGVTRESLYRSLSRKGKPEFSTIVSVLRSLGLGLSVRVVASNKVSKFGEKPNKKTKIAV